MEKCQLMIHLCRLEYVLCWFKSSFVFQALSHLAFKIFQRLFTRVSLWRCRLLVLSEGTNSADIVWVLAFGCCSTISSSPTAGLTDLSMSSRLLSASLKHLAQFYAILLYSHDQLYKHICICMQNHNDTMIKMSEDTVLRKIYLSLYSKGLCVWESWRPNRTTTYWPPHSYGHQRYFTVLQGCSTGSPGVQLSAGCWLSLPHLVSKTAWISCALSYIIVHRQLNLLP